MSVPLAAAVLATTMRLVASHEYAGGAPPGFSGGFKEESCHACHFDGTLNAAPGRLAIDGVPGTFTPGERYVLTVRLTRTGMKVAGFQLAARFTDSAMQAGTLVPGRGEGDRVGVERQGGVLYAGQKKGGVSTTDDAAMWIVEWTAPAAGGRVTIHVSANAANGDGTAEGDFVYTAAAGTAAPPPNGGPDLEGIWTRVTVCGCPNSTHLSV